MSANISFTVDMDELGLEKFLNSVINDPKTMLELHTTMARFCNEYVPFLEGPLAQTVVITPENVRYIVPYAHRQYFLHNMADDLAGNTNRTRVYHPKATSYWDKAMVMEKGDVFWKEVARIIERRAKEKLNGQE